MNLLHLTLSLEPGGRREAIRTLVGRHQGAGVRSFVGCLDCFGCEPELVQEEFSGHIEMVRRRVADWSAIQRLIAFCNERDIAVIHAHDAASQLYAALVRLWLPRIKVLMTFHRSLGFETSRRRDRVRNALAGLACHAIVVGSAERREHYLAENHVRPSKVIRIPFGIDTGRFFPDIGARAAIRQEMKWQDQTIVLGAVGHFGEEKGIDLVIRAFQQLVHQAPELDCRLLVVGDGSPEQRQRMERLAKEMPRPERISLVGFRPDVPRWFNAMDVFIHAPRHEAFGLVVAEAMATGLPVVATSTGGVPDMVRDQQTGLLVPPEKPDQLAEALAGIVADEQLRARLAANARLIALAEYPAELYAARYRALYEHLVGGRRVQTFDPFAIQCQPTGSMDTHHLTSPGLSSSADKTAGRMEKCLPK